MTALQKRSSENLRLTATAAHSESRLAEARAVFQRQSEAIAGLPGKLDENFSRAMDLVLSTRGHVVVSGMGKSGLIGKKIAATFASTGTPSFFVHPGEAYHGDLGMIRRTDVALLISYSGETEEVVRLLPCLERMSTPIIALVGKRNSTLGRRADVVLDVSVDREVCPNNLAPTSSTLAALAMGDALAVTLIRERDFRPADFAMFHPGGSLGQRLLSRVRDVMRTSPLPQVSPDTTVEESLFTMTRGRLGLVLVQDGEELCGIVTDGDLRRAMQRFDDLMTQPISSIMTRRPSTVHQDTTLAEAQERMRQKRITALVVVDDAGKVAGALELFDD